MHRRTGAAGGGEVSDFHWNFRKHLKHFRPDGRLHVLMSIYLHKNIRLRSWPSNELIHDETDLSSASVSKAIKWLSDIHAIMLVPYGKRVGDEKKLAKRKHIYQLTGVMKIDGKFRPYLNLSPEGWSGIIQEIKELNENADAELMAELDCLQAKHLQSECLPAKHEGIKALDSSEGNTNKSEGIKTLAPVGAAAVEPSSDIDLLAEGIDVTPNPDEDATTPDFDIEETPMPEVTPIPPPPNVPAHPPAPVAAKFNIDKVFDCVAWGSFGIKDMRAVNGNGGRIGKLTSGLKRRYPGLEEKDIAAKSREFYKWFRSTYADISAPRDPSKFEERWIEWEQRDEAAPDAVPAVTYDDDEVHWVDLNETIFSKLNGGA